MTPVVWQFSQPIINLYPQLDRDNPVSDPQSSQSYAQPDIVGKVSIDDSQNSITRKSLERLNHSFHLGCGVTDIVSNSGNCLYHFP